MKNQHHRWLTPLILVVAAGCATDDGDDATETTTQAFTSLGSFDLPSGQRLTVAEVAVVDVSFTRLASCGQTLFLAKADGSLFSSVNGGNGPFNDIHAQAPSDKIACDRLHLYALKAGTILEATTDMDGTLSGPGTWKVVGTAPSASVTEIASGNGNIYAIVPGHPAKVWTSQLKETTSAAGYVQTRTGSWKLPPAISDADRVTGSGSLAWWSSYVDSVGPSHTLRNRAFAADSSDTLWFNDRYLEGSSTWTQFWKPGADIIQISAEDSNTLYALATLDATHRRIIRYLFAETNCRDGKDNDANGLADAKDPTCRGALANEWCSTRTSGSYCIDRLQNTDNYNYELITCHAPGVQSTIDHGVCKHGTASAGSDYLEGPRATGEADTGGRYCSVIHSDGSWSFGWGLTNKSDPCTSLKRVGSYVARAGQFSTVGVNSVLANCTDRTFVAREATGTTPLTEAKGAVPQSTNRCVFTVSPKSMGVFNAPFPKLTWDPFFDRGYKTGHFFDHGLKANLIDFTNPCWTTMSTLDCPVNVAPFGNGQSGDSTYIDNLGTAYTVGENSAVNQLSYDFSMTEGTPLRAMGYGTVVESRDFALYPLSYDYATVGRDTVGTPFMGELYIRYDIGTDTTYQESYLAYYAHVGLRTVVKGQRVEPNQLVGYVGMTGQAYSPHLHFGMYRLTNINVQSTGFQGEAAGYKFPFTITNKDMGYTNESLASAIDPYGWRAPIDGSAASQDPAAYYWADATLSTPTVTSKLRGLGAWSPNLWYFEQEPKFPVP